MRNRHLLFVPLLTGLALLAGIHGFSARAAPMHQIGSPTIQWEYGGCYTSWCETGWYSSPAVADLDGNGTMEVIGSAYSIVALEGTTGNLLWRVKSGHDRTEPGADNVGRTWPGIVVADVDDDGSLEIVTAHGSGYVSVYNNQGYFEAGWPQHHFTSELRGLSVYDLDNDGAMEIIVTAAVGSRTNTRVYEHDGTTRSGWPQLSSDTGYAWGVFNDNAAVGDLDGDGFGEIVVPSDVHYVCTYEANGSQLPVNSMYTGRQYWGQVGVHVDHAVDIRGYAHCGTEHRPNFAHTPAIIVDVNSDGTQEAVIMGNVYNCGTNPYTSLYEMPFIFNADRTRWSGNGHDWTAIPIPDGNARPVSENYNVIESNMSNPVAADLDANGEMEILYASYDGRVHAYWLDKTEHYSWPYEVYTGGAYRFASEPAVADLDNDGDAEVIFTTWTQKNSGLGGHLVIVNYDGTLLSQTPLPDNRSSSPTWNGALAAPTLANIDDDANLEIVVNTAYAGIVAYEVPGTEDAQILWGTGRGNYQRTGSILTGLLYGSNKQVQPTLPEAGDVMTYTITLKNPGPELSNVLVTDTLPAEVNYLGNLWASSGTYGESGGVITWTGTVTGGVPVTIRYRGTVNPSLTDPTVLASSALINDGRGNVLSRQALAIANGLAVYLPVIQKN
jgi:uncharacterized repeat protein (TIGR01451 family)